jgi:hypothetical protein
VIGVSITRLAPNSCSRPWRDLVGALVLGDFLAHQEDVLVAAHLLGHRVAQRLAHGHVDHLGALGHFGIGATGRGGGRGRGARRPSAGASAPAGSAACFAAGRRRRLGRGGAASALSPSLASQHGDRRVDLHALGAFGDQDLADLVPSSTASTSIVALSVSISAMTSPDFTVVAFLHQPFGQLALLHGGRQGGHQDFDRMGHLLPQA